MAPKLPVFSLVVAVLAIAGLPDDSRGDDHPWVQLTHDGFFKQRPAWSPDGKQLVFARHRGATIYLYLLLPVDGRERRLTDRTDPEYDAVWSPDGKELAFVFDKTSPGQGDLEVYRVGADGKQMTPVVTSGGKLSHEEWPAWSPDGQWLAFSSTRDGNQELYRIQLDGQGLERLTNDSGIDAHPAWSPDGQWIAFSTSRWGDMEIALTRPDGSGLQRLTESRGLDDYPAWSPDGKQIAFTSNRAGNFEIFSMGADGKHLRNLTRDPGIDTFPTWTPDKRLTWVSNRSGTFEVYVHADAQR